jgi:hypothetical protein
VDRQDSQILPCFFKKKEKTSEEGLCCTEGMRPLFYFNYYFFVVHWKVPSSNFGQESNYPDRFFMDFLRHSRQILN